MDHSSESPALEWLRVWRAPKETGADFTTNAAFLLAKKLKISPLEAARIIVERINKYL